MSAKEAVEAWVEVFHRGDVDAIAGFYSEDAINHQVAEVPVESKVAIRAITIRDS